jgi:hypothetical protein
MNTLTDFQFSPSNLQDYLDCRRRFQLKYIYKVSWPAIQAEPLHNVEESLEIGIKFHHLTHQFSFGIEFTKLNPTNSYSQLTDYWTQFLDSSQEGGLLHPVWQPDVQRYPEVTLFTYIAEALLVSKLDLIAIFPGSIIQIYDWKTNRKPPTRKWLTERLQTKLYPYILVQAGLSLNNGKPIIPEQVEFIYWYPSAPSSPHRFPYNQSKYDEDQAFIFSLLEEISHLHEDEFHLTQNEQLCVFCVFRSLCERGIHAGSLDHMEQYSDLNEDISTGFNEVNTNEY